MTTFVVLFVMNLLDYIDRNVLMSIQPQVKGELHLSNAQAGLLTSIFLISYSVVSPVMGWLGDRYRRTWLLGLGVGLWSLATVGSGLARSYGQLALARSFLGIGEATYGVIAPTILIDLFARQQRSRLMSAFYLAMPIGSAPGDEAGRRTSPPGMAGTWRSSSSGVPGLHRGPYGAGPARAGPGRQRGGRCRSAPGARAGRGEP